MLRDSLARDADLMLHQQPSAKLEECLAIPLTQLIQNHPSHRCSERFEDISHCMHHRQAIACMSGNTIGKLWIACQAGNDWLIYSEARTFSIRRSGTSHIRATRM
jgi:hypothetical protein